MPWCGPLSARRCGILRRQAAGWRVVRGSVHDRRPSSGIVRVELAVRLREGRTCSTLVGHRWVRRRCGAPPIYRRIRARHGRFAVRLEGLAPGKVDLRVRAFDAAGHAGRARRIIGLRA